LNEPKRGTATSKFGVGRREGHDSSGFYARFAPPRISSDEIVNPAVIVDRLYANDARTMDEVAPASVALVVTSPPYFAGKEYEEGLGEGSVPASYIEYLEMLYAVFAECVSKLESGGRLAVNVANLGRKPFRSLSSDVVGILQDRLGLLLRGEIIWQKARGAGNSCAWGSFQSPANPVLRDLSERIIVASKGRFDRAISRRQRARQGLPSEASMFKDDFMDATTDVWEIEPESATRVGHPAPFPVELPQRLIELYTYRDDLVLDPFIGSGSTAVAAVRTGRHYVGYDVDESYLKTAEKRITLEKERLAAPAQLSFPKVVLPAVPEPETKASDFQSRAVREGRDAREIARAVLLDCGFTDVAENQRLPSGVEINFTARDQSGNAWYFDVSGAFTSSRPGLRRTDTLWKALGKAAILQPDVDGRLILLTTSLPAPSSAGDSALSAARSGLIRDALQMLSAEGQKKLAAYAAG
jgi:DNA modification methylase